MTAAAVILSAILVLYFGWRFYRQVNWDEPPVYTPDTAALRKREAEILQIQDFLEEARAEGKLSKGVVDEFNRYAEKEVAALRGVDGKR